MLPASLLREVVVVETPLERRNDLGEVVFVEWRPVATRRASVESTAYAEELKVRRSAATATWAVRMRYMEGLRSDMRLRWQSRGNRILSIASIVERGHREEHEIEAEEVVT